MNNETADERKQAWMQKIRQRTETAHETEEGIKLFFSYKCMAELVMEVEDQCRAEMYTEEQVKKAMWHAANGNMTGEEILKSIKPPNPETR